MTAVYADSLDQDDLFTALRERRCYATTGARMLLQMDINGHDMGQVVEVSADDEETLKKRQISAHVSGTVPIERLEVIQSLTAEEIQAAAAELQAGRRTTARLLQEEKQ